MEDIRTYLDKAEGYHKGELNGIAMLAGTVFLLTSLLWFGNGAYYLYFYGSSFEEASGTVAAAPGSLQAWILSFFRIGVGVFLGWLGLLAWDMRRSFLYWSWFVIPAYLYYWYDWLQLLDPEFRASEVTLSNLTGFPVLFLVFLSAVGLALVLVLTNLQSWAFKASASDISPVVAGVVVGLLWMGCTSYVADYDVAVTNSSQLYCIAPFDQPDSGLAMLKLVALSPEALRCHQNMDELTEALARREAAGRATKYSAYDTRPGGERLIRMLQQGSGLRSDIECPEAGWYRVLKESGKWRCSVHGVILPKSERTLEGMDEEGDYPSMGGP